jgi:serine/threonine protein kinase
MSHREALFEGATLGNEYLIESVLGVGGFGITYRATDLALKTSVAIKEYFPNTLAIRDQSNTVRSRQEKDEHEYLSGLDRFIREARTLARFKHDNIVRVLRSFPLNNTAYMVLEYVEGRNMDQWLAALNTPPGQRELDDLVRPLVDAMQIIHENNVLHRDVKPANIYIRAKDGTPVLLDFGAAKAAISEHSTNTAAIVSRFYSPFESYGTESKKQGAWTDIYGMSATLHRAITGKPPPEASDRVIEDDYKPLAAQPALVAKYRPGFLRAVDAGLAVYPRERPQAVVSWSAMLFEGQAPITVREPDGDTKRPVAPIAIPSGIPSGAVLSNVGQPSLPVAKPPPAQRGSGAVYAALGLVLVAIAGGGVWLLASDTGGQVDATAPDRVAAVAKPERTPPSSSESDQQTGKAEQEARAQAERDRQAEAARKEAAAKAVEEEKKKKLAALAPVEAPKAAPPKDGGAALVLQTGIRGAAGASALQGEHPRALAVSKTTGAIAAAGFTGSSSGRLWTWPNTADASARTIDTDVRLLSIAMADNEPLVAAAGYAGKVEIWNWQDQRLEKKLVLPASVTGDAGSSQRVASVSFFPSDSKITVTLGSGAGAILNWRSGEEVATIRGTTAAVSPDGKRVAAGGRTDTDAVCIRLYGESEGWRETEPIEGHTQTINRIAFSPTGEWIATASADRTVGILTLATKQWRYLEQESGQPSSANAVAVSDDGNWIAAALGAGVTVWSAITGKAITSFKPDASATASNGGIVRDVVFVSRGRGRQVAALVDDGTVKIWDLPLDIVDR